MLLAKYLLTVFPRVSSVTTWACPGPVCCERHFPPSCCSAPPHGEPSSCRLPFQLFCWECWRLEGFLTLFAPGSHFHSDSGSFAGPSLTGRAELWLPSGATASSLAPPALGVASSSSARLRVLTDCLLWLCTSSVTTVASNLHYILSVLNIYEDFCFPGWTLTNILLFN